MQSVWAGYGGCRFSNGSLAIQRPRPPPNATALVLRGIQFLGAAIDITIGMDSFSVALSTATSAFRAFEGFAPPQLELFDVATGAMIPLSTAPARFVSAKDTVIVRAAAGEHFSG